MSSLSLGRHRFAITLILVAAAWSPNRATAQPRCEAPRVMFVVDRSSSMSAEHAGRLPSGHSKWEAARRAAVGLVNDLADGIELGLTVYPGRDGDSSSCTPGRVLVDIGAHPPSTIIDAFPVSDPPPGNWTPTAETLETFLDRPVFRDDTRARHVVLITDGEQCCNPGGTSRCRPEERFDPIWSITRLRDLGVYTHVVGFGAGVDALTLNRSALAGGTAPAGCNVDGDDPAAADRCYVQADDLGSLRDALAAIARHITAETCDGYDDDCDGAVDEDFELDADGFTTCGSDPAAPGMPPQPALVDCDDGDPAIHPGAAEICNGVDDDCDGVTDPGCACLPGDRLRCGDDVGACAAGEQSCGADGTWGECAGAITPLDETCDGFDEDCDGSLDEGALCGPEQLCMRGACIDLAPPPPPGGVSSGACCSVASPAPLPVAPTALVVGLLSLVLCRRRRR